MGIFRRGYEKAKEIQAGFQRRSDQARLNKVSRLEQQAGHAQIRGRLAEREYKARQSIKKAENYERKLIDSRQPQRQSFGFPQGSFLMDYGASASRPRKGGIRRQQGSPFGGFDSGGLL